MEAQDYLRTPGFRLRLESRLKNAELVRAREQLNLSIKDISERIGINYASYCGYETMKQYPSKESQKRICDFFRKRGIFVYEGDIFPPELKKVKLKRKYIAEGTIPNERLIALSEIEEKLLPPIQSTIVDEVDYNNIKKELSNVISRLSKMQQQVLKMRFGLEGEEQLTCEEIGKRFTLSRSRIHSIEKKALQRLRYPEYSKKLAEYL